MTGNHRQALQALLPRLVWPGIIDLEWVKSASLISRLESMFLVVK